MSTASTNLITPAEPPSLLQGSVALPSEYLQSDPATESERALASRIGIGIICPWTMDLPHVLSLFYARDAGFPVFIVPAGPYLDIERNKVIDMAMPSMEPSPEFPNGKIDWLVCMDSDVQFDWRDLLLLCVDPDNHPVVSGIYHNNFPHTGMAPLVYRWDPLTMAHANLYCLEVGCCPNRPPHPELPEDSPGRIGPARPVDSFGMIEIDGFGAGYLAIHKDVLFTMRERYKVPMLPDPSAFQDPPVDTASPADTAEVEGVADGEGESPPPSSPPSDPTPPIPRFTTAQAYFIEQTLGNGTWYGEDFMFALRCKQDLGITLYAHPQVKGTHFKKVGLC